MENIIIVDEIVSEIPENKIRGDNKIADYSSLIKKQRSSLMTL